MSTPPLALTILREISLLSWDQCEKIMWETRANKRIRIRDANDLARGLIAFSVPQAKICRKQLINTKNREIKAFLSHMKAENRKISLLNCALKFELNAVKRELTNYFDGIIHDLGPIASVILKESEILQKYTPAIFCEEMCRLRFQQIAHCKFDLEIAGNFEPNILLSQGFLSVKQFAEVLNEIKQLKSDAKSGLAANEEVDFSDLYARCDELQSRDVGIIYIKIKKWEVETLASTLITAKINKIKAVLLDKQQSSLQFQGNIASQSYSNPLLFDNLLDYAHSLFASARELMSNFRHKHAGIFIDFSKQIFTSLRQDTTQVDIFLAQTLESIESHPASISLFKSSLRSFQREEMDIGTLASVMTQIGSEYYHMDQIAKAVKWLSRVKDFGLGIDGDAIDGDQLYADLVNSYRKMGKFIEAETLLNEFVQNRRINFNYKVCDTATCLYLQTDKFTLAETWAKRFVSISTNDNLGFRTYAKLQIRLERFVEAESSLFRVLRAKELAYYTRISVMFALGELFTHQQRYSEAEKWLARGKIYNDSWSKKEWARKRYLRLKGFLDFETGRYHSAATHLQNALMHDAKLIPNYVLTMKNWVLLSRIYLSLGQVQNAKNSAQKALEITSLMSSNSHSALVYQIFGLICIKSGELSEANQWLQKALKIQTDVIPSHRETAMTYYALGMLLFLMESFELSEQYLHTALAMQRARMYEFHDAAFTLEALADIKVHRRDYEGAKADLEDAFSTLSAVCPMHVEAGLICERLKNVCDRLKLTGEMKLWSSREAEIKAMCE